MPPDANCVIGRFRGTVIVTMHGDLDLSASRHLDDILHDLIDGQGNLDLVVDLLDVGQIGDTGVDVLAAAADRLAVRGGELRLGGPTRAVFDSLAPTGLAGLVQLVGVPTGPARVAGSPGRRSASAATGSGIIAHPAGHGHHHHGRNGDIPGASASP